MLSAYPTARSRFRKDSADLNRTACSPGILTVRLCTSAAATLQIELGDLIVGTQYDQVNITGTDNLDGALDVDTVDLTGMIMDYTPDRNTAAAVPEPSGLLPLVLAVGCLAVARGRSCRKYSSTPPSLRRFAGGYLFEHWST